jgi:uncharacterized protein YqeY
MSDASLKATIQHDLTTAMRERDQVRAGTLRMVLTAITTEEVAGKESRELTDDDVLKVVAKEAKKRKEAATAYADASRPELADRELAELAILDTYLPAQLSDAELETIVAEAIATTGAVAGRADGGRVAAVVKAALAKG